MTKYPSFFDLDFQLRELKDIIMSSKEGTSPGNDLINHPLLKLLPSIAIQVLLKIFNNILREASFPSMWHYDIMLLLTPNRLWTYCSIFMHLKNAREVC